MSGTEDGRPASALADVRVLDLSVGIAGQVAAMVLGDYGAEVIRIETDPPADRDPGAPMWDRNKRVMRTGSAEEAVASLLATADVVVTTRSASAATADGGRTANPRLVHLSLPRFRVDEQVPSRSADGLMTAASGIARRQSSYDGGPVEPVFPYVSYQQALWGATCAVAALVERERTGLGQRVTVDGMHGALITGAATMVVDPEVPPPPTAVGPHGPNPAYSTYRCADGNWLLLGALTPKFQIAAFALLGTSDLLTDPRVDGDHTRLYAVDNRDWVRRRLAAAFATRPRDEWLRLLDEVDCPAGVVAEAGAYLDHPQMLALGQRKTVEDPEAGRVEMPWAPVEFQLTPPVEPRPRAYVSDAEWRPRDRAESPRGPVGRLSATAPAAGPLAGLRVLDLGAVLAGPFAGSLLAELGAEVVKVEQSAGDDFRQIGWHYNRGQRSLAVNLRDPAGHDAFRAVVRESDVVLDNFRPGVLERLRIDHTALTRVRPDIVTGSITGFGDVGPFAGKPGFDPILQAVSGMMAAQGGDGDPVFSSIAVNDVTAACATALGSCVGLYHRARTGEGQRFGVSLTAVAAFMQCGELTRYPTRPAVTRGGADYQGPSALDRLYPTADGFVRLRLPSARVLADAGISTTPSLPPDEAASEPVPRQATAAASRRPARTTLPDGRTPSAGALAAALREIDTADVVKRLTDAGGAVTAAVTYLDLTTDPDVLAAEYLLPIDRADGTTLFVPGRYARFDRGRRPGVLRAPGLGEHSRDVLRAAGLTDEAVDRLVASGAVTEGGPLTHFTVALYR
ncbi:CoA transferase [Streptomyces gilvus]|uniref:CoA transferase n=1 Tax=Streptomyces gilvus TaxID=2920937 RepID=UPI001F0DE8D7|nr:CoA transferase [Streptomyces sp. CME 23]MCH5677561.1 CoA transferase [Streptomyces sp. CME 23]